jgi:hypothetical protein
MQSPFSEDMMQEELPVIASFIVHRRAYLAPDGVILRDLPDFAAEQVPQNHRPY